MVVDLGRAAAGRRSRCSLACWQWARSIAKTTRPRPGGHSRDDINPAPTTTSSTPAAPPAMLEGTYQVDVNRAQQTYNDIPDPQPPNVTTWWAFRSSCLPAGCVAGGILLDDNDHQTVSTASGGTRLSWISVTAPGSRDRKSSSSPAWARTERRPKRPPRKRFRCNRRRMGHCAG
ncbi:putative serine/threonine-kinase pknI domain protein [Mycobacterium xenopi 4042]|uniref:Putative serine/threonine-kinase pknI domain protein n=1 Tax=Mycobacterium xenopi 4042 TaxID=1299334 RepID=X8E7R2_MYCXE|nr:putative serine/threonine-kinase pknI domain protein [Mycobacterium xenopi 4042]